MKVLCKIFDEACRNKTAIINTKTKEEISYGYLFQRVQSLKEKIDQEYYGDKPILLFPEGKICFIIGFFAILSAGKTPILINELLKQELKKSTDLYDVLITNDSNYRHLKKFSDTSTKKGIFVDPDDYVEDDVYDYSSITMNEEDIFCYLFTSGSCGDSYLVKKTVSNLMQEVDFLVDLFNVDEKDVFLSMVPNFHIYGLLFSILLPLSVGAKIRQDVAAFSSKQLIDEGFLRECTVVISNPLSLNSVKDFINSYKKEDFQSIRHCISSTAHLSEEINQGLFDNWELKITEVYGTTESGGIAYRKLYENKYWSFFPNIEYRIEEKENILEIKSPMMSPLKEDDFHLRDGGWFSTGDVIEQQDSGFSLLGRTNQIVKVDGHRVSALEVEEVIRHFYEIEDVVLVSKVNGAHDESLIAYVVPFDEDNKRFIADLKKFCSENLASFKIPKQFIILDSISRDSNGKVDFKKLEM